MSKQVFDYDVADAAMCLWEEIVCPSLNLEPWAGYREDNGTAGLRDVVLTKLASACHEAWCRALERYDADVSVDENCSKNDPGFFDWEFCPFWLTQCVDWSGEHPRVKGTPA